MKRKIFELYVIMIIFLLYVYYVGENNIILVQMTNVEVYMSVCFQEELLLIDNKYWNACMVLVISFVWVMLVCVGENETLPDME